MVCETTVVWRRAPVPPHAQALKEAGYPSWLADLLARRGVETAQEAEAFLNPALDQLHDAGLLHGLKPSVECLLRARENRHKVAIIGDYDVDGVSGTAVLSAVLRACGLGVETILPHRLKDGYGFQPSHVDQAETAGCRVLVTVDCGITSGKAIDLALERGLQVVVTDHHLPGGELPSGVLIINPKQPDCHYPFSELSGAGLALKLALAFAAACDRAIDPRLLLRVACLGTIADMVPLLGENRVIAALGLHELARSKSVGLQALFEVARLSPPFTTEDVGFRIGPRLNAPGRLGSADKSLELLLSRDPDRAKKLAADLDAWNRERQSWERQVADEAREIFLALDPLPPILVAWRPSWHRGVVGIAAGRLARELHRPVILLAQEKEGEHSGRPPQATGSGRSIKGIHLFDFLDGWRGDLVRFGGHSQAIGLTADVDQLDRLREEWEQAAAAAWSDQISTRFYDYELEMEAAYLSAEVLEGLQKLEPFGQGNSRPLLRIPGPLRLAREPRRFGRDHIEAELVGSDRGRITIVGWGWQSRARQLEGEIEVLGHLELDRYRGKMILRLLDCRPAKRDREL